MMDNCSCDSGLPARHRNGEKPVCALCWLPSPAPLLLTRDEERALGEMVQGGNRRARHALCAFNLGLVASVANRYVERGVELEDLMQEGHVGLLRAIDKFDPARGTKFSTYATWWIEHAIRSVVGNHGRTIRLPIERGSRISKLLSQQNVLAQALGREPTIAELAAATGWSKREVARLLRNCEHPASLDALVGESGTELGALVAAESEPAGKALEQVELAQDMSKAIEVLTIPEERLVRLRYGFRDGAFWTFRDIARSKKLGRMTAQRLQQIDASALRKLREVAGLAQHLDKAA